VGRKRKTRLIETPGPEQLAARATGKVVTFTREEILVRLINTAIGLWFHGGDMLSVHMLGAASYKTLCDLTKKTGKVPWLTEIIGDEKLTLAYDFLRHAPSDLSIVLDFPPGSNMTLLAGVVTTFESVFGYRTDYMSVLMLRFISRLPVDSPERRAAFSYLANKYLPEDFVIEDLAKLEGAEFFNKSLKLLVGGKSGQSASGP
jgi:hypothetical protein